MSSLLYNPVSKEDNFLKYSGKAFLVQKNIVELFGEKSARLISQIHYLSNKKDFGKIYEGRKWVFNTFEYLANSLCISLRHTKRIASNLCKMGVLRIKKLAEYKSNRTNYYTIDYDLLNQLIENMKSPSPPEKSTQDKQKKMALWPCQNGTMVNTNKTNKEINKSEEISRVGVEHVQNVLKQVEEFDIKNNLENSSSAEESNIKKYNPTTAKDMLTVWNQTFERAQTTMTKDVARHLVAAYNVKFSREEGLSAWKRYCAMIATSHYLMADNFKLSLMWALKFSTIERILNCDLGVKEIISHSEDYDQQALEHIQSLQESPCYIDIRHKLLTFYGAKNYLSWFKPLTFSQQGNQVHFEAPNRFHAFYILQHFSDILKQGREQR